MLLNIYASEHSYFRRRGHLVSEFVDGNEGIEAFAEKLTPQLDSFSPMSLVILEKQVKDKDNGGDTGKQELENDVFRGQTYNEINLEQNLTNDIIKNKKCVQKQKENFSTKREWKGLVLSSQSPNINIIDDHIISIGNSHITQPFLKVQRSRNKFKSIVENLNDTAKYDQLSCELLSLLRDQQQHWPDTGLQRQEKSHDELKWVSSNLIQLPGFGTRTHTIILIDWEGKGKYIEINRKERVGENNKQAVQKKVEEFGKIGVGKNSEGNIRKGSVKEIEELDKLLMDLIIEINSSSSEKENVYWQPNFHTFQLNND